MNPSDPRAQIDPQQFLKVLQEAHDQVTTALWLSAGMLCAFAAIGCMALAWRRAALAFGFFYSLSLCFVRNGHAQILGPLGCAWALMGLFWPRRKIHP